MGSLAAISLSASKVRYIGKKKGEIRTLIKATGRWIEFSALNPDLELTSEADWLLNHRKDFVRR